MISIRFFFLKKHNNLQMQSLEHNKTAFLLKISVTIFKLKSTVLTLIIREKFHKHGNTSKNIKKKLHEHRKSPMNIET